MTMTALPPPDAPTLVKTLHQLSKSWTAWMLFVVLVVAEMANFGVLPAILQSIEAKLAIAKSTVEDAKANVAKMREDARADEAAETARVKAGQAVYADRFRKADARYQANHAAIVREKAINSPQLKQAEIEIKRQTIIIDTEKAQHEARRARAEAALKAAQAEFNDADARKIAMNQRADLIEKRKEAFFACTSEQDLRYQRTHGGTRTSPCDYFSPDFRQCEFRWERQCLASISGSDATTATQGPSQLKPVVPRRCAKDYAEWQLRILTFPQGHNHAAYVVGDATCFWSAGKSTLDEARKAAIDACQNRTRGCLLYREQ